MKKYLPGIVSWIACVAWFYISAAIVFKIALPFITKRIFDINYPPRDGFGKAIQFSVIGIVIILYALFFGKTVVGQRIVRWFFDVNKFILQKK